MAAIIKQAAVVGGSKFELQTMQKRKKTKVNHQNKNLKNMAI